MEQGVDQQKDLSSQISSPEPMSPHGGSSNGQCWSSFNLESIPMLSLPHLVSQLYILDFQEKFYRVALFALQPSKYILERSLP